MWRELDLSYIAGGNVEDFTIVENYLTISCETKHTLTVWPINCSLGHLSQRNENLFLCKNLCINAYRGFTPNSKVLETTHVSFSEWRVLQISYIQTILLLSK